MRNKTKHASPFRWMLRRYVFLLVAVVAIAFAVFPMQGMMRVMSISAYLKQADPAVPIEPGTIRNYTRELTLSFVYSPLSLETVCLLFGGLGFGAALVLFRHLFSRKQSMMVAGLPMTRGRDFHLRCMVYAVWCLLPLGLCILVHPLVVMGNGLSSYFDLSTYLLRTAATLLINLYGFALGALCASVFSTFWSAGLGGMMIAGSVEATLYFWILIACRYLSTMYLTGTEKAMLRWSPIYSMYKAFYQPDQIFPFWGAAAAAVLLVLGRLAYGRVKPENAGHTLNMKKLEPVILAWVTVTGGTLGAVVLTMYLGREVILYIGLILGAAAVWLLTRMLLDQRIRISFRGWKIPAFAVCAMLVVLLGLRGDWLGYNGYAPKIDQLAAIRIRPEMGNEELVFAEKDSMEACMDWVKQMRTEASETRNESPYRSVVGDAAVIFEEKGGRAVTRQYLYPEDRAAVLPALRLLAAETERQRAEIIPNLSTVYCYSTISSYGIDALEFQKTFGFSPERNAFSRLDARQVREALRKDMLNRTLDTLQQPNLLNVYFEGLDPETGEYNYSDNSYRIKPGDTNTLKLILGDEAEKWIDYANGGFFRSGQVRVFLCEYSGTGEDAKLLNYQMAESEEEVRDWLSRVTRCSDAKFSLPVDSTHQVKIYSIPSLRNLVDYGDLDLDPEDPETLKKLPELTDGAMASYSFFQADV